MKTEKHKSEVQTEQLDVSVANSNVLYRPTMMLRYKWKEVITPIAEHFSANTKQTVLQQMWIGDLGEEDWRDIETVK